MKRLLIVAASAGAAAALAAGCGSSGGSTPAAPPASSGSSAGASGTGGAAIVKTAGSPLGQILVDGSGRTLYLFTPDTGGRSVCTGQCASIWPPDTTAGTPHASGVATGMLGTTTRPDHTLQVTFAGHPLYRYSHDAKPGDVNGQGVQGIWFAVNPSGNAVAGSGSPSAGGGGGGY